MTKAKPPGWDRAAADVGTSAADSVTADDVPTFGYDPLDTLEFGWVGGYDVIDWIHEGREHDIATLCPVCRVHWLMGPETLAAGMCWQCRTAATTTATGQ
jgi:hypothetical protein